MTYVRKYTPPPPDEKEVLRYAGVRKNNYMTELSTLVGQCVSEADGAFSYKVCYAEFPVKHCEGELDLGFTKTTSLALRKNLTDCESVIVFVATVGLEIDRMIAKYSSLSPSRALIFQSLGAERAEALADCFCDDMKREKSEYGYTLCPRFSAGYGDLPLSFQREIFSTLDAYKHIGVALGENMLMSPSKSVSAIIGVKKAQ